MKKLLPFIVVLAVFQCGYSQINFEKGYFISNDNIKTECLIKNIDWKNNPTTFKYRLSLKGDIKIADIESVKEFGIYDFSKYIRAEINIDRSSDEIEYLSRQKAPKFNKEQLFLKALVTGKASLYTYEESGLVRFFFSKTDLPIEQLVYKSYLTSEDKVSYNNHFRVQIWNTLKCNSIKMNDLKYLRYDEEALTQIFLKYNNCNRPVKTTNNLVKSKAKRFFINIKPRISNTSLEVTNINNGRFYDFGSTTNFELGVEFESVFAFNRNKWAFVGELNFGNSFKGDLIEPSPTSSLDKKSSIDYSSIEVGLGGRHYMFLNDKSKLFINVFYVLDLAGNSKLTEETIGTSDTISSSEVKIENNSYTAIGLGYKYNNKYSVEFRLDNSHSIFNPPRNSEYTGISLILGYTIL
ncbi:porin family protein [Seonamhaeicola marinus]|uniref:PorT family protein n=1 Tax=Seonamhaeicola marinus TaxID=1912246 RepID=A0A5D0HU72_9FLAO|nr:PorT family protein [Seonamhaeicola marinus]TYA74856.1 PorT family protein [Seonamhaeicola marinus]